MPGDNFGGEISMDKTGSTVAASSSYGGYVDIFKRCGSNGEQWQKFARISQQKHTDSPIWSFPVSLSGRGDRVAIGDPTYNHRYGRDQIYWLFDCAGLEDERTRQNGANIVPDSSFDADRWALFGGSLILSYYGRYLAVGAPNWSGNKGYVRVFFKRPCILKAFVQ